MQLFSVEPERKPYTKWVMLIATLIAGVIAACLLMAACAGCASVQERGWKATLKITIPAQAYGNRPERRYEATDSCNWPDNADGGLRK